MALPLSGADVLPVAAHSRGYEHGNAGSEQLRDGDDKGSARDSEGGGSDGGSSSGGGSFLRRRKRPQTGKAFNDSYDRRKRTILRNFDAFVRETSEDGAAGYADVGDSRVDLVEGFCLFVTRHGRIEIRDSSAFTRSSAVAACVKRMCALLHNDREKCRIVHGKIGQRQHRVPLANSRQLTVRPSYRWVSVPQKPCTEPVDLHE